MNIQGNGIYQADCLVFLERIESEQASLAYLDPPAVTRFGNEVDENKGFAKHLTLITNAIHQVRRILNVQGNVFFQSDPYFSGDYRQILNQVFGRENFQGEYILPNLSGHNTVIHYSKGIHRIYHPQFKQRISDDTYSQTDEFGKYRLVPLTRRILRPSLQFEWHGFLPPLKESWIYSKKQLDELDKAGRILSPSQGIRPRLKVYLEDARIAVGSIWDDIPSISTHSKEHLHFPTQSPLLLLNRIISMASNQGDLILDPFCGSGTSLISAQLNGRRWLGCDTSAEAYSIAVKRFEKEFEFQANRDFSTGDQKFIERKFPVVGSLQPIVSFLEPIDFYSCFISYSSQDEAFAQRLFTDLKNKGVQCWFAPKDMKIGDRIRSRIDESIRIYDKLLLVLSQHSVASTWVEFEVETAMAKEQAGKPPVLFPIRLDNTQLERATAWAAHIKRTRHIGDFRHWKDHDEYQKAFTRLLRNLRAE